MIDPDAETAAKIVGGGGATFMLLNLLWRTFSRGRLEGTRERTEESLLQSMGKRITEQQTQIDELNRERNECRAEVSILRAEVARLSAQMIAAGVGG